jgi:hypothetical protein
LTVVCGDSKLLLLRTAARESEFNDGVGSMRRW